MVNICRAVADVPVSPHSVYRTYDIYGRLSDRGVPTGLSSASAWHSVVSGLVLLHTLFPSSLGSRA